MRHTYDREADALYIYLSEEPYSYGQNLDDARRVDFGPSGQPMGIELLYVSDGVEPSDLPRRPDVDRLLGDLGIKVSRSRRRTEGVESARRQLRLLRERDWTVEYDRKRDTLYLRAPDAGPAISYPDPERPEILYRLDMASGTLTGLDLERFRLERR